MNTAKLIAFGLGVLVLVGFAVSEALALLGWRLGSHECGHGIPWGLMAAGILLVAPAMLGPETAAKLANLLPGSRKE